MKATFTYSGHSDSYTAHSGQVVAVECVEVLASMSRNHDGAIYQLTAADGWQGFAFGEELTILIFEEGEGDEPGES